MSSKGSITKKEYSKKYYLKNKNGKIKEYKESRKDHFKKYRKKYYLKNKSKALLKQKEYILKNKEYIKKYQKKYRLKNRDKLILQGRKYYKKNRKYLIKQKVKYFFKKYNSDPKFRLISNLRRRMLLALQGKIKEKNTMKLLGVPNIEFLKNYLESKFKPGMSWEKRNLIHIDHILPCASFDLSNPKQQAKCFHYTNLQPLWAHENLSKGSKILKSNN